MAKAQGTAEVVAKDVAHLDGCPAEESRVERYVEDRPGGGRVTVTRCQDCGAHAVSAPPARSDPRAEFDET